MPGMTQAPRLEELNPRALGLLKALIEQYIREGQPVGSRTLARAYGLGLSAATIRNVMADLDELGLVRSPHTSAGRIPTVQGYRLFVDRLLKPQPLGTQETDAIKQQLFAQASPTANELMESASQLLSSLTHMAGVVTVPRRDYSALRQIEFLPLSGGRVLAILVVNEREVQNRILHAHRDYSAAELQEAANYLNAMFAGRDLVSVRETLLRDMLNARASMDQLMVEALSMAEQVIEPASRGDYVLAGETNLMGFQELSRVETLKALFEAFERKRDLLRLFDNCLSAEGMQIFIGEESGYTVLDDCSVVSAPYTVNGQVVGVLGVIGPTRMDYDRVISIVDTTARLLSAALKEHN
jgi:heat-inducible transcriptional repressor